MSGRLVYRDIWDADGWLEWVEDLEGRSGAYVIRSYQTREVLYVGESHSGRLRNTLKRHFWRWADDYTRPHHVYSRNAVEVATRLTAPSRALATQNALIRKLNPRDNRNGWGSEQEDIPF